MPRDCQNFAYEILFWRLRNSKFRVLENYATILIQSSTYMSPYLLHILSPVDCKNAAEP